MKPIRLLLVEDYLTDQLSFKRFVKKQALPYDISSSVAEVINSISKNIGDISFDTAVSNAMIVSTKIQTALSKSYPFQGQERSFTASIGIAIFPKHANNSDTIINKADQAMYLSKKQGGNSINIYQE